MTPAWTEMDSNHRSNLQQIYSLSPLATRESAHIILTSQNDIIKIMKKQAFFVQGTKLFPGSAIRYSTRGGTSAYF